MATVRLINENTQNIGVVATAEAMRLANEANLDLVEVAPDADPPVCRIMDYGKHKYRLKKKQHLSHVRTHHVQLKELRLSPVIEEHDVQVKLKRAREFFSRGDRVTFNMMFRGRQMLHKEVGHEVMVRIAKDLEDVAKPEASPKQEGKRLWMTLAPKPHESAPAPRVPGEAKAADPKADAAKAEDVKADVVPAVAAPEEPPKVDVAKADVANAGDAKTDAAPLVGGGE